MPLDAIYANLACTDLVWSTAWFQTLFGREPDAAPMPGLVEWHHDDRAGLQLNEEAAKAGRGTLTLLVSGIDRERARLGQTGWSVGTVEDADYTRILRLTDPDGKLVVLAEPKPAAPGDTG